MLTPTQQSYRINPTNPFLCHHANTLCGIVHKPIPFTIRPEEASLSYSVVCIPVNDYHLFKATD